MQNIHFEILQTDLLYEYLPMLGKSVFEKFSVLKDSELSAETFNFYTSVSAVFSSKIEGEDIDLDSFIKHKKWGIKFLPDHTCKIDDLYEAYLFAKENPINALNIKQAHILLTTHILQKTQRGKLRTGNMYVTTPDGKIEYVACPPDKVKKELNKLYADIALLLDTQLSLEESLFFSALIHLVFVKIHPFDDGNGRTARLLEKWFLAQKTDNKAWFVQSEKYYYDHHQVYYQNIRKLGLEYELLDYSQSLQFLLMLPQALIDN